MIVTYVAAKALSASGLIKCPKCKKARIEVKVARRTICQRDGLEGVVARCRTCGNRWVINSIVPVV